MPIITISSSCYSHGREVAEKVAKDLGYECISRGVLIETSGIFNIPEIKLKRAIHDAPSILDRFKHGKEKYVSYIRTALLRHVQKDNVLYHGFAGHFFLQEISHALKVRIIAKLEDRIKEEMETENITAKEARYILKKDDDERRNWGFKLYGLDTWDPNLYDMVINLRTISVDEAVKIIQETAELPFLQTTKDSQNLLEDLTLASQVESLLVEDFPKIDVTAKNREVFIHIATGIAPHAFLEKQQKVIDKITAIAITLGGAEKANVTLSSMIKHGGSKAISLLTQEISYPQNHRKPYLSADLRIRHFFRK